MRLLLIRHGRTAHNVTRVLDTAPPGAELDEVGRRQADELADRLEGLPIDALYVSDLTRTAQTAAPLAARRGLRPIVRAGLREIQAGDDELSPDWSRFVEVVTSWQHDPDRRMPGAETGRETLDRFDAVLREADAAGWGTIAVVSHGAIIRMWTFARATNLTPEFLRSASSDNTVVVELVGSPDRGWRVCRWGDRVPEPVPLV